MRSVGPKVARFLCSHICPASCVTLDTTDHLTLSVFVCSVILFNLYDTLYFVPTVSVTV